MDTTTNKKCAMCKGVINNKRLRKYCRSCLDTQKEEKHKYKTERENSTICLCCKLYKDTNDFIPANKFKYCIGCRESKAKYKKDITPPPSPTHSEIERRPDKTATPIIQNRRKLHRNIEVNLSMLYQYFKERYNIQETEQELFNNWENGAQK